MFLPAHIESTIFFFFFFPPIQGSARPPRTEEIHYGQIDFSSWRQEPTSPLDSKQDQYTLYAQVKVCQTENSSTQSPQITESVYAQVNK